MYVINCESREIHKISKMSELESLMDQEDLKADDLIIVDGKDFDLYKLKKTYTLNTAL